MFQYFIRRTLLIIPTFLGVTFLVFFILQVAPDGPYDRALNKLKNNQEGGGEVSMSSNDSDQNLALSDEDIEHLKAEFGLDKPLPIRYLIWLGLYDKQVNKHHATYYPENNNDNYYFRDIADELRISHVEKYYLQKWIHVEKKGGKLVFSESGVGLKKELPIIEYFIGEKFTDSNNNNQWDDAEKFIDAGNGTWDDAEIFIDINKNKKWDVGEEFTDLNNNNQWDDAELFIDVNRNSLYDDNEEFVDTGNGVFDSGEEFTDCDNRQTICEGDDNWSAELGNGVWDKAEEFIDSHSDNKYNQPKKNFNQEKYNAWIENYNVLPNHAQVIKTWYKTNWKLKEDSFKENFDKKDKELLLSEEYTFEVIGKKGILTGYLGKSRKLGEVSYLIKECLPVSATFGLTSLLLTYLVCIPLGIFKAIKNGSKFDFLSSIIVFIGYSIPGYILGSMLIIWIGGDGSTWPVSGFQSDHYDTLTFFNKIIDRIQHFLLPGLCYIVGGFAWMTLLMKNSLLENLSQDYVRTAFAKGLSEKRVIFLHAVRNSLIPLATGIGGMITVFLAGSYLIETTFEIKGLGLLGFNALMGRDYDIIMGTLAISTILGLIGNLISDLVYALLDPRIRFK